MTTVEFQKEFLSNVAEPASDDPIDVIRQFVALRTNTLAQARALGVGESGSKDIRKSLATAFVRRWMLLQYAAVDLSFTKRDWFLRVVRDGDETRIVGHSDFAIAPTADEVTEICATIPRYFSASIDADEFAFDKHEFQVEDAKLGAFSHGQRSGVRYSSRNISVSAVLPDGVITKENIAKAQKAIGHAMMPVPLLMPFGINFKSDLDVSRYNRNEAMKIEVIWAPNVECLSVISTPPRPAGDPAILLRTMGHAFLLDFYDTPDEAPIAHLIREFSEGRLSH